MNCTIFSSHGFERKYLDEANSGRHNLRYLDVELRATTAILAQGSDSCAIFSSDDASADVVTALYDVGIRNIALRSAGYNHVDIDACRKLGIRLAYVPEYSPYSVAEHTVLLMLALNRKLVRAHSRVRELNFSLDGLVGFDMYGKTVGILGVGRIGAAAARILRGFGCTLLGYDLTPSQELMNETNITYTTLETVCRNSDIIAILMPLTPKTHHLINDDAINSMKEGVMIVNTSRGGLVDTAAAIRGLKSGKIGYLGVDVYEREHGVFFHDRSDEILLDDVLARLMTFPNVLITSHQGFLTAEALRNISAATIESLDAWQIGLDSPTKL